MRRRLLCLAVLSLIGPALLGGCASEDRLTVYSGRSASLVGPLLQRFNAATGIGIDVRYGDSAELALLIEEEGENTPADVFYSQSPGATGYLGQQGLLGTLPDADITAVDERFRDDEHRWVGVTGRQRALVYNADLVAEEDLPDSVLDVVDDEFAGRVAVAPTNGSFQDFVTALRQVEGEDAAREWLTALASSDAPTYANNNAIVEAVGRGEVPMGLVNHYYNERFLEEDPSLPSRNHVFPGGDIGALLIASTVSVTGQGEGDEDAEALVAFLLSEEAQRFFADETKEYPLAAGVEPAEGVEPLDLATVPSFDIDDLGGGLQETIALIEESGLGD